MEIHLDEKLGKSYALYKALLMNAIFFYREQQLIKISLLVSHIPRFGVVDNQKPTRLNK